MARAVGTQRRHLVQTFLYEGAAYDLAAAAVGAVLGIGVSFVMVQVVAGAFTAEGGLDLALLAVGPQPAHRLRPRRAAHAWRSSPRSAWRVSRLNIVSAIRDLPEQPTTRATAGARWVLVAVGVVVGTLLAVSGATSQVVPRRGCSASRSSSLSSCRSPGSSAASERLAYTAAGGLAPRPVAAAARHLRLRSSARCRWTSRSGSSAG